MGLVTKAELLVARNGCYRVCMDSDYENEYQDYCDSLANAYLCDNAEPKPEPEWDETESDGIF